MTNQKQDVFDLTHHAAQLVDQNAILNVSGVVALVAEGIHFVNERRDQPFTELCYQAAELAAPINDYESAAEEAGWKLHDDMTDGEFIFRHAVGRELHYNSENIKGAWQSLCEDTGIEPHQHEVFEHWAVSSWLADKLEAQGEKIDRDFAGLIVWARTATGQSTIFDSVIVQIVEDLFATGSAPK